MPCRDGRVNHTTRLLGLREGVVMGEAAEEGLELSEGVMQEVREEYGGISLEGQSLSDVGLGELEQYSPERGGQAYSSEQVALSDYQDSTSDGFSPEDNPDTTSTTQKSSASRESSESTTSSGVIYARVSSNRQAREGNSLQQQVQSLSKIAKEQNIDLVREPIRDDGETGTDFDRPGIQEVRRLAMNGEISCVLVDDVDRIGRHSAETIFYLYELRSECGVTVITAKSGELDVETFNGLAQVMLKSLSSQIANENRARRAHAASVEKFKQKDWSVFYDSAPLGYELTDGWLEIDESEAEVVEEIFRTFLRINDYRSAYSKTADRVAELSDEMRSRKMRQILQNRVYIGEPSVNTTFLDEDTSRVTVSDDSLQIVSKSVYQSVQEKVDKVHRKNSSSPDNPDDLTDFVDEFGFRAVIKSSDIVELRCPDCGESLVKNGQRKLSEREVHNYKCTNDDCGRQRKFPTQVEIDRMRHY